MLKQVVLGKTPESFLLHEINQSILMETNFWIYIEITNAKAKAQYSGPLMESDLLEKTNAGKLRAGGEGSTENKMVGIALWIQCTWIWANIGR